jgi:hypothetical protein
MHDPSAATSNPEKYRRIGFAVISLLLVLVGVTIDLQTVTAYVFEQSIVRQYASTYGHGLTAEPKVIQAARSHIYKPIYGLQVTYGFDVQGVSYEGTRCGYEGVYGRFLGLDAAQKAAETFPGSAVTVFYNSTYPADCYMLQPHSFVELVWPVLLILIGLPGTLDGGRMVLGIKQLRRTPPATA